VPGIPSKKASNDRIVIAICVCLKKLAVKLFYLNAWLGK
jgi:hypothetical protein